MNDQWCVNCNAQVGYPHTKDCPRPKYRGEPDDDSPNGESLEKLTLEACIMALEQIEEDWPTIQSPCETTEEMAAYISCEKLRYVIKRMEELYGD